MSIDVESQGLKKSYRQGPIGALMDEYERAAWELRRLVEQISPDDFARIVDPLTEDDACRSVQTILSHVVNAGYGYADYLSAVFSVPSDRPPKKILSHPESLEQLDAVLEYTARTLDGRW